MFVLFTKNYCIVKFNGHFDRIYISLVGEKVFTIFSCETNIELCVQQQRYCMQLSKLYFGCFSWIFYLIEKLKNRP